MIDYLNCFNLYHIYLTYISPLQSKEQVNLLDLKKLYSIIFRNLMITDFILICLFVFNNYFLVPSYMNICAI